MRLILETLWLHFFFCPVLICHLPGCSLVLETVLTFDHKFFVDIHFLVDLINEWMGKLIKVGSRVGGLWIIWATLTGDSCCWVGPLLDAPRCHECHGACRTLLTIQTMFVGGGGCSSGEKYFHLSGRRLVALWGKNMTCGGSCSVRVRMRRALANHVLSPQLEIQ